MIQNTALIGMPLAPAPLRRSRINLLPKRSALLTSMKQKPDSKISEGLGKMLKIAPPVSGRNGRHNIFRVPLFPGWYAVIARWPPHRAAGPRSGGQKGYQAALDQKHSSSLLHSLGAAASLSGQPVWSPCRAWRGLALDEPTACRFSPASSDRVC